MLNIKLIFKLFLFIFVVNSAYSQQQTNFNFDTKVKQQTVKKISKLLDDNYIFPETAKKMGDFVKSKLSSGSYDSIDDPMKFAETLTTDLQSISNDKHIRVRFSPDDAQRLLEQ
jgi:predicted ATP-dependent Lon-type protease